MILYIMYLSKVFKLDDILTVFILIFVLNFKVTISISETERMFFILELWGMILAIILLIKNKLPQRKYINSSLILSILVTL